MTDLQSLSDDELRDLYARSQGGGGGGGGYAPPDTSWADHLPIAGSGKDQSHLEPMQARPLASPGSQGAVPSAGGQGQSVAAAPIDNRDMLARGSNRVSGGFDAIEAQPQRPQLQAGLEAKAGAASLQDMSDDDLKALYQQTKGPGAGITRNVAAGMNNALYATAGAPVDLVTWGLNKGIQGVNAATGANLSEIQNPIGGSQSIANAFGTIGVDDPANVQANTTGERIARGVGEGIGYTVGPQAAVGGLAKASALSPEATAAAFNLLGWPNSTAAVAGNAVAGGASGGGAAAAMEATPDRYDPLSGLAGGMAGGAAGTLASGLPRLANEGLRVAGDLIAPMTPAGRERLAGQILRKGTEDPRAAAMALEDPGVIVPGSNPTTFQQTGDMGLGKLERKYAAQDPAAFNQRRADQNAARLDALGTIQPEGNPQAITQAFRARLADIDQQTDAAVQAALQTARGKAQALGGSVSAEASGDAIRTAAREAETAARESERALWRAVDPENKLALQSDNSKSAAASIRKNMPETAKPMDGEEAAIFEVAAKLKPTISFNAMSALRSRVSTLMRQEMLANGRSPTYGRLSQLRGAIESDVEGVLSRKAAQEAEAVAAGTMRQEDTIAAKWAQNVGNWVEGWRGREVADSGQRAAEGFGGNVASRATPVRPVAGADRPGRGQLGETPSDQGMAPDAGLTANFDDDARGRLAAASDATKQRARTFGEGAMGSILRRSGDEGAYQLQNAAVPEKLFFPGGRSAENIAKFRKAVGDERALGHIADYAVSSMRRVAETPEGIIDPKRLEAWRRRHGDALKEFPALNAKFADAERASQAAIDAGARRAAQLEDAQKGVFGKLIGAEHPDDITRMVGSVFGRQDASAMMGQLARTASGNPEAIQGLRKSVVDYMLGRLVSNTEAATSGRTMLKSDQFQSFIKQNRAALKRVFGDTEIQRMEAVAADLQQANRSISAVKLPGGSNTVQDALAVGKGDSAKTMLTKILLSSAASGGAVGFIGGPITGAATMLGTGLVMALRQNGINTVDDLVRDALLHPDRAALLLQRGSFKPGTGPAVALMRRYKQAAITGAATTRDDPGGAKQNNPLQVTATKPANWAEALAASDPDSAIGKLSGDRDYAKALGLDR